MNFPPERHHRLVHKEVSKLKDDIGLEHASVDEVTGHRNTAGRSLGIRSQHSDSVVEVRPMLDERLQTILFSLIGRLVVVSERRLDRRLKDALGAVVLEGLLLGLLTAKVVRDTLVLREDEAPPCESPSHDKNIVFDDIRTDGSREEDVHTTESC